MDVNEEYAERTFKLFQHMKDNKPFMFSISGHDKHGYMASYEFGTEAEGSPMCAGASYGTGDTLGEALEMIYKELRIM